MRFDSDLPQVVGEMSKGWMFLAPLENIVDVQLLGLDCCTGTVGWMWG